MPIETNGDRRAKEPENVGGSLFLFFLLMILLNLVVIPIFGSRRPEVLYSEFLQQVKQGKVEKVLISPEKIRYILKDKKAQTAIPENIYETTPVGEDSQLVELLEEKNVTFGALPPDPNQWIGTLLGWIIPPLIFVGTWMWLLNRAQGGATALTVGKSKARIYSEGDTGVTFKDVAGVDEAKEELQEIVEFLKQPEKYTRLGAKIPKGVLLVGPPGTGKTLLAKAVAGEAGVPFFSISGAEFVELFVGVGAARVRDLFVQAKKHAPCIVFIDELDALGKSRAGRGGMIGVNDEQEQTLNQLLTEMDGFEPNTGVIILAATNRPEVLDPALLRPGRFDRQVLVDRPDKNGRLAILQVHSGKIKLAPDVDLEAIAARTSGFAGADLANLVNEAALLAARKNREQVTMADFNEAFERVVAGLEKKSRVLNPLEKQTVAYHEVGHAIVATVMPGSAKVEKISIVPRGIGALGYTLQLPEEDRFLMLEDEIRGRIATLLGGRAAEEIVFGKVSTGASDDLQKATDLAERAITMYGMSKELGAVTFEKPQAQFLDGFQTPRRPISGEVAQKIDREVQQIVEGARQIAKKVLAANRSLLEETAQRLLQKEVLEGKELEQYLSRVQKPAEIDDWLLRGYLPDHSVVN